MVQGAPDVSQGSSMSTTPQPIGVSDVADASFDEPMVDSVGVVGASSRSLVAALEVSASLLDGSMTLPVSEGATSVTAEDGAAEDGVTPSSPDAGALDVTGVDEVQLACDAAVSEFITVPPWLA